MTLRSAHEKPVYVRLREVIADAILAGRYGDGDSLPSVRALAAEQGGVGMFVAPGAQARLRNAQRNDFITNEWPEIRDRMTRLGIDPAELLARA